MDCCGPVSEFRYRDLYWVIRHTLLSHNCLRLKRRTACSGRSARPSSSATPQHSQMLSTCEARRLRMCAVYLEALLTGDRQTMLTSLTTCKRDWELKIGEGAGAQAKSLSLRESAKIESPMLEEGLTTALDEDRLRTPDRRLSSLIPRSSRRGVSPSGASEGQEPGEASVPRTNCRRLSFVSAPP